MMLPIFKWNDLIKSILPYCSALFYTRFVITSLSIYMLIITQKNNKTFRGEEDEMEGEDAAVTNGAATNGEKVSEEARPKAE